MDTPTLSIVISIHDEEANLRELIARLRASLAVVDIPYEILLIDDGSADGSLDIIRALHANDSRINAIVLTRNFGHQAAIAAGIDAARGAAVLCMDGDLQHPPELIPTMFNTWRAGNVIVHMVKTGDGGDGWLRRLVVQWSYASLRMMSDGIIHPNASDFYLLDRRIVDELRALPERSRYHRGLIRWFGHRTIELPFTVAPRTGGRTAYTIRRRVALLLDGLTSFSRLPLRLATVFGFFVSVVAFIYGAVIIWQRLTSDALVSGWATVVVLILFLGGIQLLAVGIIGEYIGRLFIEVKGRPPYVVRERIGVPPSQ
ncbi:glycosyltransferase family 2 protein [Candidatus Uhrbacteria bacterium]|nr:glycosyltransferase family 2 protein [Candidatus Uhrbacteria bacterium]